MHGPCGMANPKEKVVWLMENTTNIFQKGLMRKIQLMKMIIPYIGGVIIGFMLISIRMHLDNRFVIPYNRDLIVEF